MVTSVPLRRLRRQRKSFWEVLRVLESLSGGAGLGLDIGKGEAPRTIGEYPLEIRTVMQMAGFGGGLGLKTLGSGKSGPFYRRGNSLEFSQGPVFSAEIRFHVRTVLAPGSCVAGKIPAP